MSDRVPDSCEGCSDTRIVMYEGEYVCVSCGMVASGRVVSMLPERLGFTPAERDERTRTGAGRTQLMHDYGMSTMMGDWTMRDARSKSIPKEDRSRIRRLQRLDRRVQIDIPGTRTMTWGLRTLTTLMQRMALPKSVQEEGCYYLRQLSSRGHVRGRSLEEISAAIAYLMCRMNPRYARTLEDVSKATNLRRKVIARNYRFIVNALGIRVKRGDPKAFLSKYTGHFNLSTGVLDSGFAIIDAASTMRKLAGKSPNAIAAAVLYLSAKLCNQWMAQSEIAVVAGVTEVTMRNRYKDLFNSIMIEVSV